MMRTAGRLGCIALLACCCAVFYGVVRFNQTAPSPIADVASSASVNAKHNLSEHAAKPADVREQLQTDMQNPGIDTEFRDYATYKYRYLFATGSMNGLTLSAIESLLTQREAACRPDSNNADCTSIETRLKERLHPTDHARYTLLKDSDAEQHHTTAYADGIQHLEPLNAEQERALLETRLRIKEVHQVTVNNASPEVQLYALNQYQSQLLGELKPLLSEEQFALLSSYEQTEFETARQRLLAASQYNEIRAQ
jgi:hypothetical protein